MKRLRLLLVPVLALVAAAPAMARDAAPAEVPAETPAKAPAEAEQAVEVRPGAATIQIAILLDHSGSMRGLIDQARTHLWAVVNQFAAVRYEGKTPNLQVALYKYGNTGPEQLLPLTGDLDAVSEALFSIGIVGGTEKCGETIAAAVNDLKWSASTQDYKAVFIAGNEAFTQGPVDYRKACKAAIAKGIIVNTIHCGTETEGRKGMWHDGAALADGSFLNINQNRFVAHVESPHDAALADLNRELNSTYIAYGKRGEARLELQRAQDDAASKLSSTSSLERVASKAGANYKNAQWDLVDAVEQKAVKLEELEADQLPDAMKDMDAEQRVAYVKQMAAKRAEIKAKIKELSAKREAYVTAELKKRADASGEADLRSALIDTAREQLSEKNYEVRE